MEDLFESLLVTKLRAGKEAACCWHMHWKRSSEQIAKNIAHMIAYLARYGRQSMLQWEDIELSELRARYLDISDLLSAEGGESTTREEVET